MSIAAAFLTSVIKRFKEYRALGDKTFAQLDGDNLLQQPDGVSNNISIIIQHMHGNMLSRWTNFLTEDGEKSWRLRDAEFETKAASKEQLLGLWNEGWDLFLATLETLTEEDLLKTITIRQQPLVVIDAINRQMAHYSYHVGQIVYIGRWAKGESWQSLSIPIGASLAYNGNLQKKPN